ncbi:MULTISPECIES: response regulator transcription factor [Microcystis]|jgi:DNA-binding response OmpR family regulator|uniref:Two-component response regulator n=1 Tax=Microcystis aeruginosa NIES-44 TaxID=449439 RepID=A0A0A1VUI8_MICAE|nr:MULTISPECIES: response regulator transcription factor [Microcystis]MCZ8161795.1 response regulator transcription factor [Microcystis sp. LE19-196.1B]MCZ8275773.1 response regulator transcription factor [Microcystis sp. LE19-4.1E]MCA2718870.1 response regulator transcription factor [Microcystis sp. M169S2]MCZ8067769.1 response regulator transcription factor [Microcystis sp. LE17-20D]WNF14584.1 response regulator transcription factor [Microcystis aeruginosa NRERC-214]
MNDHILLVEDDPKLAEFIATELHLEGYQVTIASNGMDGLKIARDSSPDLLILDWMLPVISGLDLCLRLRKTGMEAPIIILTAKDEIPDRVTGLNAGADDYVTKPFSMEELLARVKARLRRTHAQDLNIFTFEDLTLNCLAREVYRDSQLIELTAKEFDLLEFILRHPRQVLTREQILETVWGYDFMGDSNIIEVYIRALRVKLESANPKRLIHTVRGVGYVLRDYA